MQVSFLYSKFEAESESEKKNLKNLKFIFYCAVYLTLKALCLKKKGNKIILRTVAK
jgi:hypothetical protein